MARHLEPSDGVAAEAKREPSSSVRQADSADLKGLCGQTEGFVRNLGSARQPCALNSARIITI